MPTATEPEATVDGRNLRRDRNREAVVEALLGLYREGVYEPSTDQIADRAGISARSVFRYFEDNEALVRTAIERQQVHLLPLYELTASPQQPLPERIDTFLADRVRLLEGMGNVGRVARALATRQPVIAKELGRIRTALRAQLEIVFRAELHGRPEVRAALDVLCSWETYDLLVNDQGLTKTKAIGVLRSTARRLLEVDG